MATIVIEEQCRKDGCNSKSLAAMVDHICSQCEDMYVYCLKCIDEEGKEGNNE